MAVWTRVGTIVAMCGLMASLAGCGVAGNGTDTRYVASGPLSKALRIAKGWEFEGKAVDSSAGRNLADASVVALPDGRIRIYANEDTGSPALRRVVSFVSSDGLHFERESGIRLENEYAFTPYVIILPDGRYRMYMTDQTNYVDTYGAIAIKSAVSDDGLTFVMEPGDRLAYLGTGNEAGGIRHSDVIRLKDGSYRMYYKGGAHEGGQVVATILSATSPDGLVWTREPGERIDRRSITPLPNVGFGNPKPYLDAKGVMHLFVGEAQSDDLSHANEIIGIFDETSTDGLAFTHNRVPVVQGFYLKEYYHGNPASDPYVGVEDQMVVATKAGLRMYFFVYGASGGAPWTETGIFTVINRSLR